MVVGVLALQGDVAEHVAALRDCGAEAIEVRDVDSLNQCQGLILPGGESTTMGRLLDRYHLLSPLRLKGQSGMPMYGTCAGLILLATEVQDGVPGQQTLGLMDMTAVRNAYGRQVESFEAQVSIPGVDPQPFPAVFIRAPSVARVGAQVEVLGSLDERIIAVRQGKMLATAFHPELSGDTRMHRYFMRMVEDAVG